MPAPTIDSDFWPEPVTIIAVRPEPPGAFVTITAAGQRTRTHYTTTLPLQDWRALQPDHAAYTFDGDARPFRLALEGERLRLAHTADPLLAANNALVDLLPHQMEAVYGVMLPQPRIRHLMAHDAGAGKTVMGGLLYRELAVRQPGLRALIVAPAALTRQWQRELREKFLVDFEIVDRESLRKDLQYWTSADRFITSTPFARQSSVQAALANVPWDLVLVDEAHHMAGYSDRETLAYELGRILSRNTKHLVLATATPHKGDSGNFLKLLQLLDGGIHDPAIANQRVPGQRGNPIMLRRLKEEMVDFDGKPLFKPREVRTRLHTIGENPPEMDLYRALTRYIDDTYRAAERTGGATKVNTEFAMVMLQRRMASSFAALEQSLLRRKDGLLLQTEPEPAADLQLAGLEDEGEYRRWEKERAAETESPARTRQEREKEVAELDNLLALLDAVRRTGRETKVEALQEIMAEMGIAPGNGEPGSGEKLLVFTEARDTLLFLRRLFEDWGYVVTQIDGSMPQKERIRAEQDFKERCQIMVATEAAGEGINLQFCAHMVNYDLPWVPTRLEQRMGRIHRYGQKRVARIFNLVAADTREGQVLGNMMERLDQMRADLGDGVFDVVSTLISDAGLEKLMAGVATAPELDDAHERALRDLMALMAGGAQQQKEWRQADVAINHDAFREMKEASRQSRLTPEYAQHFFTGALAELGETPAALPEDGRTREPGDAAVISLTVRREGTAAELGLPARRNLLFTFQREAAAREQEGRPGVAYLGLGSALFGRLLDSVHGRWAKWLPRGARFIDPALPPGDAYLLWFLAAQARDGRDEVVAERLFAARQSPDGLRPAPAACLNDLAPSADDFLIPQWALDCAADPQPVLDWSAEQQQLPFLRQARGGRDRVVFLGRESLLADARQAERAAQEKYDDIAFSDEEGDSQAAEEQLQDARRRVGELERRFDREAACSLGPARVLAVAAVFSPVAAPAGEMADERPLVAAAAERFAAEYERQQGREVVDVSGEHREYPYDLHSTGPGGVRCIEVKGATSGRFMLSENEHRAASRYGASYYIYVVTDPLGERPSLTIIRDPWAKMAHDDILYSGARYVYNHATWRAAAAEEITL